jgi:hypothetical protein
MARAEQIVTPCFARLKWQWGKGKSVQIACREAGVRNRVFIAGARNTVDFRLSKPSA